MKKTIKSNPLKTFNDNKALAVKKMGGAQASFKKKLPKAQLGTPFQQYMKTPGAVASDTSNMYNTPKKGSTLDNAFSATYGNDYQQKAIDYGTLAKFRGDNSEYKKPLKKGTVIKKTGGSTSSTKMKKGGVIKSLSKAQYGKSVVSDNTRVNNPYKTKYPVMSNKKKDPQELSIKELDALSHQRRGMGESYGSYVKKSGSIMNDLGQLTPKQQTQLKKYMGKASIGKKIYEALPNIGRLVGVSAADIPKGSKLEKQKKGGVIKSKKK